MASKGQGQSLLWHNFVNLQQPNLKLAYSSLINKPVYVYILSLRTLFSVYFVSQKLKLIIEYLEERELDAVLY